METAIHNHIWSLKGKQIHGFVCCVWDEEGVATVSHIGQISSFILEKDFIREVTKKYCEQFDNE